MHKMQFSVDIMHVDKDVVVLAVAVMQELGEQVKLYNSQELAKNFHYITDHQIANSLGPQKQPMFHALTGCDTVSIVAGHGKKTAWSTWHALTPYRCIFELSCGSRDIPMEAMMAIERFIILLYDRTNVCSDINKAQQKLFFFRKRTNVKTIPPN